VGRGSGRPSPTDIRLELLEEDSLPEIEDMKDVERGEGETAPGRVEIIWKDTVARAQPARLAWRGSKSRWQLPGGISLGSSLREIEGNVYQIYMDFE